MARAISGSTVNAAAAGDGVFSRATPADDADIRRLLRETPTPDATASIAFTREPSYFAGEGLLAADDISIVARRANNGDGGNNGDDGGNGTRTGELLCTGRCSTRPLLLNGEPRRVGYLGGLRMRPRTSGAAKILRGGFQFFHDTAALAPADFYFTSIAAGNERARRVLETGGGRLGLPAYAFLAELVTLVAPVRRTRASAASANAADADNAAASTAAGHEELRRFLAHHAPEGQCTLPWDDACWHEWLRCAPAAAPAPAPADAAPAAPAPQSDGGFCVVRRAGRIVAAAALWDQRQFQQIVLARYGKMLRWLRPVINAWAWATGRPRLPREGTALSQAAVFGLTFADAADSAAAWPELWQNLQAAAGARGIDWLTLAADTRDPRLPVLRRTAGAGVREYHTRLYEVRWRDLPVPAHRLLGDGRPFRPEVALL